MRIAAIVVLAAALSGGAAVARPGAPDGGFDIAFTASPVRAGSRPALCVGAVGNVANARRLAGLGYVEAAWSSNGRRVAVAGGRQTTNPIRVETAAGKKLKPVTSPRLRTETDSSPTWSPNGKTIAFSRYVFSGPHANRRRAGVWMVTLATGRERQLTRSFPSVLAWAPTGDVIAADLGNDGTGELVELLSRAGHVNARFKLPLLGAFDRGVSWSPNGQRLAVGGGVVLDRSGAVVARYAQPSTNAAVSLLPSWAPDGSIVFERAATVYHAKTNERSLAQGDLYMAPSGGGPIVPLAQTPAVSEEAPVVRPGSALGGAGTTQRCYG